MLNREALRAALNRGPAEVIKAANKLGYCRGIFENGLAVLTTPDADDWLFVPQAVLEVAQNQFNMMPEIDMGR